MSEQGEWVLCPWCSGTNLTCVFCKKPEPQKVDCLFCEEIGPKKCICADPVVSELFLISRYEQQADILQRGFDANPFQFPDDGNTAKAYRQRAEELRVKHLNG